MKRVLLIGLDGATFDVLGPLMEAGRMPNLKALMDEGVSGLLESTRPPITPAAWTTFMTGKSPGKHSILDFLRYDAKADRLDFNCNAEIRQQTIWQILSAKDYRVGSIHVPMTFPPEEVNGFMISGFDTPPGQNFTYPKALQGELLARYPDYTHEKKWQRKALGGDDVFAENLRYIRESFDRGFELARFCGEKYGWDVMMVLFKLVDNLQHKAWRYLDPRTRGDHPRRARQTEDCLAHLDGVLGRLRGLAEEHAASIVIMSDHGHGSLDGKAQPNLLLANWGYLKLRGRLHQAAQRGSVWWRRVAGSGNGSLSAAGNGLDQDLAFDWPRSEACVLHAGIYGFLYINLRGRQPHGIVEPGRYEALRREIRERLLAAVCRDREGREIRIFPEVHLPEELYDCRRGQCPSLPDLLLAPADGLAVVKKIRGRSAVRWTPLSRLEGTHRLHGVFVAHGPGFAAGRKVEDAHIADIAPTLLAALGERVPKDMDGKVLHPAFERPLRVEYEPPQDRRIEEPSPLLSAAQTREVAERLAALGYLD